MCECKALYGINIPLHPNGEMAEWSIALPWKGSIRASVSGVRIPLSPLVENGPARGLFS